MSQIFVAGGSGFIGTNFRKFYKNEYKADLDYCTSRRVVQFGELNEFKSFQHISFKQYDLVIHAAAFTGGLEVIKKQPDRLISENTKITLDLLEACARDKVKNFVFISSSAVYPSSFEPLKESDGFVGDPDPAFFGPGWMKRYCEKLCAYYSDRYGMNILIIRPSNVYGPYDHFEDNRSHVIPALIKKFDAEDNVTVFGLPNVIRDFIYVDDFSNAILALISRGFRGVETYNVASGISLTMDMIASTIENVILNNEQTLRSIQYYFDTTKPITRKVQKIDITKMKIEAQTKFYDGIQKTYEYYKSIK